MTHGPQSLAKLVETRSCYCGAFDKMWACGEVSVALGEVWDTSGELKMWGGW